MEPEIIVDYACYIGENPLWQPLEKRVYWTDIPAGRLFRYDPATGQHEPCYTGAPVGGFTFQADGELLLFMEHGRIAKWHGGELQTIIESIPEVRGSRFNDVIADPLGRVFCGTMAGPGGNPPGRLFRLDTDGSLHPLLTGIGVSNGLGFTPDRKHMYYTDSSPRKIYRFDYDQRTGALANQQVWLETPEGEGVPDGMTVDAAGDVWSARWDGSALFHYSPQGDLLQRIAFPARKVSSVTFGGDDFAEMYVTTALGGGAKEDEGAGAGALFRLKLDVRGVAEFYSRILI